MKTVRNVDVNDEGVYPPDDFTGEWIVEWPNGHLKFQGCYVDGKEEGRSVCYWENGQVAQEGKSINGKCVGIWLDYHQDGYLAKETDYGEGRGDFNARVFDREGQLIIRRVFIDRIKVEEEFL